MFYICLILTRQGFILISVGSSNECSMDNLFLKN